MDEALVRALKDAGIHNARLKSAQYYRGQNKAVLAFETESVVPPDIAENAKRHLTGVLPEVALDVTFSPCADLQMNEADADELKGRLCALLCAAIPAMSPALRSAKWEIEENKITMILPQRAKLLVSPAFVSQCRELAANNGVTQSLDVTTSAEVELDPSAYCGAAARQPLKQARSERSDDIPPWESPSTESPSTELPSTELPPMESLPEAPFAPQAAFSAAHPPKKEAPKKPVKPKKEESKATVIFGNQIMKQNILPMNELAEDSGRVCLRGFALKCELKPTKGGSNNCIVLFSFSDYTNSVPAKMFMSNKGGEADKLIERLNKVIADGDMLIVRGDWVWDSYMNENVLTPRDISVTPAIKRMDDSEEKRVELHLHTTMSSMDGLIPAKIAIGTAADWGHKAVAVTDHGVVQAFPEAAGAARKRGIKLLFGCEGYLIPDSRLVDADKLDGTVLCVRFIKRGSYKRVLSEIAAVRLSDGARMDTLINTGNGENPDAPIMSEAARILSEFIGKSTPVVFSGEDAALVYECLRSGGDERDIEFVDISLLNRHFTGKLKASPEELDKLWLPENADFSSAQAEAETMCTIFAKQREKLGELGCSVIPIQLYLPGQGDKGRGTRAYHIILLTKTQDGLKNLYRMVSYAHLDYFHKVPRIPRSLLATYRQGIILGSACEAGELFRAMVNGADDETLDGIASWYDYLEIQPIGNNAFMVREGTAADDEALRDYNRRIVAMGERLSKPVAATGDVHFLNPDDATFRAIIMQSKGFSDADMQAPLYLKTTKEMLEEFSYLGEQKAHEVVIDVPNMIADMCDELKPYPDGTYAPDIEGADEILKNMSLTKAHEIYGDELPPVVQARLDKELNSIITHGFASLYMMAQRLVTKSLGDGYLVGSRGSVGSSLVATFSGITEVNALPPHYVCPNCKHSDFEVDKSIYACGIDLPDRDCPVCGTKYKKSGYDIPFEVFLGFHGDKTPDIDLNFSGEYQPVAHSYTEEMFGEGHAFRAGTISVIQEKTAFGYVSKYCEETGRTMSRAEKERLALGCTGVKRTTGQHPGGMVVLPADREIYEFTPVQYPADEKDKNTITTHFDFHALDDRLVKLDILGHDDPTALRMLQDITGLDPRTIPLDDEPTMKIYSSVEPLGISLEELKCDVGSLGIPEFGTQFVRGMLRDTRPTTMEELVRIAGLSHGTDVWLNNAQILVENGTATLKEVICTRDDIMNYLIACGGEPSMSFKTMESVRKGRGLKPEMEEAMRAIHVPEWFVDSCKKIKYMFPRAHAVAYVMMSFRIAYYKVHYPLAFYAVYYTVRADAFDAAMAMGGAQKVLNNIKEINKKGKEASNIEKDLLVILEVVYEMNLRGIELLPVDIYGSDATRFKIEGNALRPPLGAVAGVGANAAVAIAEEAKKGEFISLQDFVSRTKANTSVVAALKATGCMDGMPETNQVSLFQLC